jgi:DNA replication and repair protein RecF
LRLRALVARQFRNLGESAVRFDSDINLIVGGNGQGKTSLLEAIAVLTNLRSFRTARWGAVASYGKREFGLLGEFEGAAGRLRLEQRVELGPPVRRRLLVNRSPASVERYLGLCPIAVLSSSDSDLITGPPAVRRALIDRFAFLLEPSTLGVVRAYQRTLRQRNAALAGPSSGQEVDAWDARLAGAAARLLVRRLRAVESLVAVFETTYSELRGPGFPTVSLSYRGDAWLNEPESPEIVEESYRKRYNATRVRDRHAGHSLEGPHRHDLRIDADDQPAKEVLSSGQIKVVAAALRLATVLHVERERGEQLPVMVDDVDAELDRESFARLAAVLAGDRQLLLTSARGDVVAAAFRQPHVLRMVGGSCCSGSDSGD